MDFSRFTGGPAGFRRTVAPSVPVQCPPGAVARRNATAVTARGTVGG